MLEIRLLGQFTIKQDGVPIEVSSRPAKTLLAYLLLTKGTPQPREKLAGQLWPASNEKNARKNLRQALWQLRKAIGDDYLLVDTNSILFNSTSPFWLDIEVLENTTEEKLEVDVSVYEGELLPGFYEDWILLERDRLDALYARKMQRLLTRLVQEQRWTEVLRWAERWIAQGQIPEAAYRAAMIAHAAAGERLHVEKVYQRCVNSLINEIGVDPSDETINLYHNLLAGEKYPRSQNADEPLPAVQIIAPPVNLPAQTTPFIGRLAELAKIEHLLTTTRLLTLTGPGGIGKSRLALQAAAGKAHVFDHGCFFISLAPIRSVHHLIQRIAEAVDFPLATHEDPQHQLLRYFQKRQVLLVMDNFEHLLDGVGIVSEILRTAQGVTVLATSRERLNLHSETIFKVGGMTMPDPESAQGSLEYDAISLFVQSARKVSPGFDPSPAEFEQIANICQTVHGMPLGIELAAAWLHILNVNEIASELEKGFDILATDLHDAPQRHRSIRAVFDHSWSLLPRKEQEIFIRLSIFRGGFTRDAAQQVAGASLEHLVSLLNKSFLSHNPDSARLEVHELLRQYAQERLEETPEICISGQKAHAAYYAEFMQQRWGYLKGKGQTLALAEIEADIENVRGAWRFHLNQKNVPQLWKSIKGLWYFHWVRWWNHAGMELFAEAGKVLHDIKEEDAVALRALAMAFQAYFMAWLDLSPQGYELVKDSVAVLETLNRPEALALAYDTLSVNSYFLNRYPENIEASGKMLKIATELNDKWLLAFTLFAVSMATLLKEDYIEASRVAETNLLLSEEIGDVIGTTMPLIVLGHAAFALKDLEKAEGFYQRCLRISEQTGFLYSLQTASKYLAKVTLSLGKIVEAEKYLYQSLTITKEIGFVRDIINLFYEFARLRVAQGLTGEAVELLVFVIQHPASLQTRMLEGRIRDSAKHLLCSIEAEFDTATISEAKTRGEELTLDEIIERLTVTTLSV